MSTFAEDIEAQANGEPILAVVIACGEEGWNGKPWYDLDLADPARTITKEFLNTPLSWDVARPLLHYNYDTDNTEDCHDIIAWTQSRVLLIQESEVSTSVIWVPRNPPVAIDRMMVAV